MGIGRLKDMLRPCRTGHLTDDRRNQLAVLDRSKMYGEFGRRQRTRDVTTPLPMVEATWQSIAAKYLLSPEEFDTLCFIDHHAGNGQRVFYPFHCVSKNQARAAGWDWCQLAISRLTRRTCSTWLLVTSPGNRSTLFASAKERHDRLCIKCNRNGEKAGFGEKDMNAEMVVYWMAHWVLLS
jgi:hypothetical protein